MADTVVTIGGDSTGLQGAFKDAGKSAGTVKVEAKKLSDQLKEVADDADKAAGALAQKLGGPGAIKAIAGVGAAMGIAKAGVEAFLDSSENLFKSYGDEGQKVWDETEKSLFAVKGAFAEAVLGGGSMEEMGARLKGIFDGVKRLLDGMLLPIKLVTAAFWDNAEGAEAARKGVAELKAANDKYVADSKTMEDTVKTLTEEMWALTGQTDKLNASRNQGLRTTRQVAMAEIEAAELAHDMVVANDVREASHLRNKDKVLTEWVKEHGRISVHDREAIAAKVLAADQKSYDDQLALSQKSMTKEREAKYMALALSLIELDKLEADQKAAAAANAKRPPPRTVAAGPAKPAGAEDPIAFARMYGGALQELTAESVAAIQASEVAYGESTTSVITTTRSKLDTMLADNAAANAKLVADEIATADKIAKEKARRAEEDAQIVAARSAMAIQFEIDEFNRKKALREQAAAEEAASWAKLKGDLYTLTVNNSAKMLAVDLQDKEKSKTAAQRATAAVIQGLGDMAMVKSGLAAAAGNFAEAAGFSVVGTLAYGIAAKLAPSEKTKTTAPAAATGGGGSTTNTSYNLRVDAAFADGESVARRFAEMQQGAQRRGLI
jgi:hypothetical protein